LHHTWGAICAAAVATWACVRMRSDVLIVGSVLRSCAARHFRMRSRLMASVGGVVGLLLDSLLMCTLGNGVIMFIKCVTCLLASLWGMGIFAVFAPLEPVAVAPLKLVAWEGCPYVLLCAQICWVVP